jgi:hypothetical protein
MSHPSSGRPAADHIDIRRPGLRWPLILGAIGFACGFFGPMLFVPDANQGPLVGILISGPAGVLLGFALLITCAVFRVSARWQWRMLRVTAVVGAVAILILVQPDPALRGYVMDMEVKSCASPRDIEEQILDKWSQRLADTRGRAPQAGWKETMRQTIHEAPGVIIDVEVRHQISVFEKRKPWNRGALFATAGRNAPEEHSFYVADRACSDLSAAPTVRFFEKYDLNGPIRPSPEWPPRALEQAVDVSTVAPVPSAYEHLE